MRNKLLLLAAAMAVLTAPAVAQTSTSSSEQQLTIKQKKQAKLTKKHRVPPKDDCRPTRPKQPWLPSVPKC